MSRKSNDKANTIDRSKIEGWLGDFIELAIKNPKNLEAFLGNLSKKMHDLTKTHMGGDSTSDPKNIAAILFIMVRESERGCALAGASFLEEELASLLKGYFVNNKKYVDEIFSPSGPLDSFSSRINMSYCLGLISNVARKDLNLIRKIRNRFAHSAENVSFEDTDIKAHCDKLYHDVYKEKLTPRWKYIRVVTAVALEVHMSMASSKRCVKKPDLNVDEFFTKEQREMLLEVINSYRDRKINELTLSERPDR
jgi:DNA-binding MltR family transcriptional regulator